MVPELLRFTRLNELSSFLVLKPLRAFSRRRFLECHLPEYFGVAA